MNEAIAGYKRTFVPRSRDTNSVQLGHCVPFHFPVSDCIAGPYSCLFTFFYLIITIKEGAV